MPCNEEAEVSHSWWVGVVVRLKRLHHLRHKLFHFNSATSTSENVEISSGKNGNVWNLAEGASHSVTAHRLPSGFKSICSPRNRNQTLLYANGVVTELKLKRQLLFKTHQNQLFIMVLSLRKQRNTIFLRARIHSGP